MALDQLGGLGLLATALKVVAVVALGVLAGVASRRLVYRVSSRFLPENVSSLSSRVVFYSVVILSAIAALSSVGVELTALAIAGGFTGLVVSFALQPILSNFFSGLYLFGEKSVVPGDVVSINGYTGRVVEVATMSTKILTLDGYIVRIPNSRIIEEYLVNYSKTPVRRLTFKASIAYKEDAEEAIRVIRGAIDRHYLVLEEPPPEVYVSDLGDSGVEITVRVWVPADHWYEASMSIMWSVKRALSDAGIEIPFNQLDIWLRTPIRLEEGSGEGRGGGQDSTPGGGGGEEEAVLYKAG